MDTSTTRSKDVPMAVQRTAQEDTRPTRSIRLQLHVYVVSKDGPNTNSTATGWTGDLPLTGLEQGHYVNVMVQILPPSKTLSRTTSLPVSSRMMSGIMCGLGFVNDKAKHSSGQTGPHFRTKTGLQVYLTYRTGLVKRGVSL
ncbi:uncharacterized protein LOC144884267 isoform X2 [Branchiostoma floridae x Branchiostoma japonicum]